MKEKNYKYRKHTLKGVKKNLEFRKSNYYFLNKLNKFLGDAGDENELGEKMIDFLHCEENLRTIFKTFLEGSSVEKIVFDFSDDENYEAVISLASRILRDFFSARASSMKKSAD